MSGRFTDNIDLLAFVSRGRRFEGNLAFSEMPRLQSLVGNPEGQAAFKLDFVMEAGGIPTIQGMVESDLILECQRCMGEMDFQVAAKISLGIVKSPEQAERLPGMFEPLSMTGDEVSIASIVEDELILALPTIAMHDIGDCPEGVEFLDAEQAANEETQVLSRKNPFAALAQLKDKLPTDGTKTDEE